MVSRREFVRNLIQVATILTWGIPSIGQEERRRAKSQSTSDAYIDPATNPTAKSLNYVHNKKDIKNDALKVTKSATEFKDQTCKNCQFYEPKGKDGTCQLIPGGLVKAEGWCISWAKKV